MEMSGRVIAALPERGGSTARGDWKAQDFVIESNEGQYPRKLVFTVFGADRLQRFNIQIGQDVTVLFDIDAHEWNGRWFNDIRAYDVRPVAQAQPAAAPAGYQPATAQPTVQPTAPVMPSQPQTAVGDATEDLPF